MNGLWIAAEPKEHGDPEVMTVAHWPSTSETFLEPGNSLGVTFPGSGENICWFCCCTSEHLSSKDKLSNTREVQWPGQEGTKDRGYLPPGEYKLGSTSLCLKGQEMKLVPRVQKYFRWPSDEEHRTQWPCRRTPGGINILTSFSSPPLASSLCPSGQGQPQGQSTGW